MSSPHEKLASSLEQLEKLQLKGRRIFCSNEFSRAHRERLLKNDFLREVIKGWLMSWNPDTSRGDSSPWYDSFWEFCSNYCRERFGSNWSLSPEQSLQLHAEKNVIPGQVVIYSSKGSNNTIKLPFNTSLFDLKIQSIPKSDDIVEREGLRMYSVEAAVLKVSESFFLTHPLEARIVLSGIQDASNLLTRLLDGGHSAIAGRLVGAFRSLGHANVANDIRDAMKAADYDVRETDPFKQGPQLPIRIERNAPISNRLRIIWEQCREVVVDVFPEAPGLPRSSKQYMNAVDDLYIKDAYHSLSIEGYQVTPTLINKVRSGNWNPENSDEDRQNHNALSARGYWQTYQQVRRVVDQILQGENAAELVQKELRNWYRELFQPMVIAGLVPASTLAGFRSSSVFIKGSRHVPPRNEIVVDAMTTLFELLQNESKASVRSVVGHWLIGYIHPFMDGNGRIARFFMNAMLASGGYPWTVIPVDKRETYMQALECASVDQDIKSFAQFIANCVENPVLKQ